MMNIKGIQKLEHRLIWMRFSAERGDKTLSDRIKKADRKEKRGAQG